MKQNYKACMGIINSKCIKGLPLGRKRGNGIRERERGGLNVNTNFPSLKINNCEANKHNVKIL